MPLLHHKSEITNELYASYVLLLTFAIYSIPIGFNRNFYHKGLDAYCNRKNKTIDIIELISLVGLYIKHEPNQEYAYVVAPGYSMQLIQNRITNYNTDIAPSLLKDSMELSKGKILERMSYKAIYRRLISSKEIQSPSFGFIFDFLRSTSWKHVPLKVEEGFSITIPSTTTNAEQEANELLQEISNPDSDAWRRRTFPIKHWGLLQYFGFTNPGTQLAET
ncbi:hypothetical protein AKO1_003837, partial [Acrasis kona]